MSAEDRNKASPQPAVVAAVRQASNNRARGARLLLIATVLPLALATAASYLGACWWGLALIPHFRPHLAMASIVILGISLKSRARIGSVLCAGLLVVNTAPLLPYLGVVAR